MELKQYQGLPLGSPAPDFSLPGVDGKTYSLASFKDKPVLAVVFWCNHSPYVQAWEDRTIATQRDYASKGVQFVAINPNETEGYPEDDVPHMVERAKMKGYNFPYLRDETQRVAEAYGGVCSPASSFCYLFQRYLSNRSQNHATARNGVKRRHLR